MRLIRLVLSIAAGAGLLCGANDTAAQPSSVPEITARPEPPLTEEKRADILMARKMYREAIEKYESIEPQTAIIANKTGIAYHQLMQLDRAKKYYERSIKMDRRYAEAINNVGTVHYARKSFRRAVSFYKRALKITPNSASIYSNLGTAEFARKRYKQAVEAYQKALSFDSDIFEHRSSYGTMLQERTVEEKAKFHYYLAKTYAQAGYKERALQYLRKALEEGFKDRQKMAEDPEFAPFRESPEFQELLAYQPRVL